MLSFDRGALESRAARVDGSLRADDPVWEEGDTKPADAIHVTGRISAAGDGRFYLSGKMDGEVDAECRRCLTPARSTVSEELHLLFADETDEEASESDVYMLDPRSREVDLRPAVREQWLLAVPAFVLCREDCKGLCPRCGADLNAGSCHCEPVTDPRWHALKNTPRTT